MITGRRTLSWISRIAASVSSPESSGIIQSSNTMSGLPWEMIESALRPLSQLLVA
jgi:hypothetical protein